MAAGGWAGPAPSLFRVVVEFTHGDYKDDSAHVYRRAYVECAGGSDFRGTILSTSWAGQVRIYGGGTYADSGWVYVGDFGYGHYESLSAEAHYNSYSGRYYKSEASQDDWNGAPVWQPYAIDNLKVERKSDNETRLSWGIHPHGARPYKGIYVDQQIDDGSWSNVRNLGGGSTSWTNAGTAPNHKYKWRVVPYNDAGQPSHTVSAAVYNTPSAPKIASIARTSNTTVKATLDNTARTATALEYQSRKKLGSSWSQWSTKTTVDGLVKSFTVDLGGGTFQVRARNVRGDLASDWSNIESVVTICPPAAPTLIAPGSSAVIPFNDIEVTFGWRHNSIDGSAQTAAELELYSPGYDNRTEKITGPAASLTVDNDFGLNAIIHWRVRTKGADADFGPWSPYFTFGTAQRPTVTIEEPADGFVATDVPIDIRLGYIDQSGKLLNAVISIEKDGREVYTRTLGTSTECSIDVGDWVPDDSATYTIVATVRSTSGFQASTRREFSTKFRLPQRANLDVVPSPDEGTATLRVVLSHDPDLAKAVSVELFRIRDGTRTRLGSDVGDGDTVVDRFCPLNTDFAYEVVTVSGTGAVNVNRIDGRVDTPWWFIIYDGGVAKAMWEPSGTVTPDRPADELKELDGRTWPLLVQGRRKSLKIKFEGWVDSQSQAMAFREMALASGDKVYKGLSGDVWHCHAEAEVKEEYDSFDDFDATVTATVTRVSGGDL